MRAIRKCLVSLSALAVLATPALAEEGGSTQALDDAQLRPHIRRRHAPF